MHVWGIPDRITRLSEPEWARCSATTMLGILGG